MAEVMLSEQGRKTHSGAVGEPCAGRTRGHWQTLAKEAGCFCVLDSVFAVLFALDTFLLLTSA
ncbi:hypothetical protein NDU88_006760, partial [Pleurodeles waltl]